MATNFTRIKSLSDLVTSTQTIGVGFPTAGTQTVLQRTIQPVTGQVIPEIRTVTTAGTSVSSLRLNPMAQSLAAWSAGDTTNITTANSWNYTVGKLYTKGFIFGFREINYIANVDFTATNFEFDLAQNNIKVYVPARTSFLGPATASVVTSTINQRLDTPIVGTFKITNLSDTPRTIVDGTPGQPGEIYWDANFVYICVAPNSWKRTALSEIPIP
jgi:hypothetical protein